MAPTHHIPETTLVEYASGAQPEAVALLVATHLALCPACRVRHEELEALGGELLDGLAPADLSVDLGAVMARLGDAPVPAPLPPKPPPGGFVLPRPLRDYVGPLGAIQWTGLIPGIQQVELDLLWEGVPVRLTRLRGGTVVPTHSHTDEELSLVLTGGFEDEIGHYVRGDVSVRSPEHTHTQRIDKGEACITLAVNRGRMVPTGIAGKLIEKLTGGF